MYVHDLNIMEIMTLSTKLSEMKKNDDVKLNLQEIKLIKSLIENLEENYKKVKKFEKYLNNDNNSKTGVYELISQEKEILTSCSLKTVLDYCIVQNIIDYVSFEDIVGNSRLYRINFIQIK